MRKEDLKNWTRDMLKGRIMELEKIVEQWKCDNGEMLQIMKKTQNENNELRKRLGKLESDICGTSPCIVSEFHLFEGESWIKASTYDDVLLRLKNANERITDLEQDMFNKSMDEVKQVEKLQSENKSLKQQNDYLKNIFETEYIPESAESIMRKYGFSEEFIQDAIRMNEAIEKNVRKEIFKNENDVDKDKLISELQDQHQQDCIRYNDMRTAYLVTLDELARLREQFGAGK